MELLQMIGSSVVIVALINMVMQNKSNQITHITDSRAIWRQDIKNYTKKINSSDGKALLAVLDAIKVNLNGYGCHKKNEYPRDEKLDFLKDEHIWKSIDRIETECIKGTRKDNTLIKKEKDRLCQFLVLLLKFDWERSKDEVKKNMMAVFSVLFFCLSFLTCCLQNIDYTDKNEILSQIPERIQGSWVLIILYLMLWIPCFLDKYQVFKTTKWYKDIKACLFAWTFGSILELVGLCFLSKKYDIDTEISILLYLGALVLAMLYLISIRIMYMEYDNHIMEILQLDSLVIYPMKALCNSIRVCTFFISKEMNCRQIYKNNEFINEEEFKVYINSLKKSRKVLKRCWGIDYFFRKKKDGLYNYIQANPNRCKCVVKYQKEGGGVEYSAGYQKKLWNEWLNK